MEHRRHMQHPICHLRTQHRNCLHGIDHQVSVAQHDAFRATGGATGVEQPSHVITLTIRIFDGFVVNHISIGDVAFRHIPIVNKYKVFDVLQLLSYFSDHRHKIAVNYQHAGFRVVKPVNHFRAGQPGINRLKYAPGPGRGKHEFEIAITVQRQHGDAAVAANTQLL